MSLASLRRLIVAVGAVVALYQLFQAAKKEVGDLKAAKDPEDIWVLMANRPGGEIERSRNALLRRLNALMEV